MSGAEGTTNTMTEKSTFLQVPNKPTNSQMESIRRSLRMVVKPKHVGAILVYILM
jgi:hypothetical protein